MLAFLSVTQQSYCSIRGDIMRYTNSKLLASIHCQDPLLTV